MSTSYDYSERTFETVYPDEIGAVGKVKIVSSGKEDKTNPSHYRNVSIEPIDVIESWGLGFHLGNTLKYIKRAGLKEGQTYDDDIRKAIWYLERTLKK